MNLRIIKTHKLLFSSALKSTINCNYSKWNRTRYLFSNKKDDEHQKKQINESSENKSILQAEDKQNSSKYQIIDRIYKQKSVPGNEERKYTNLNKFQEEIIAKNAFDVLSEQIVPKSTSKNTFTGIVDDITQISLGSVKIKDKDQVFLSEVDPQNIPQDLNIKFDKEKQLKIIGKQSKRQKKESSNQQKSQSQMQIQPQTIEQKTITQHMNQQFGIGFNKFKYSNWKNIRRWDIFLSVLFFIFIGPIFETFLELNNFYKSTKAIQEQRMKQISQLKQRSFRRVLLQNADFNKIL